MGCLDRTGVSAMLLALIVSSAPAQAEVRVGYGSWRYDLSGEVTDRGRTYDYEEDLEMEPSGRRSVLLEIDTKPGWWPAWSASYSQLGASGDHEEVVPILVGGVQVGTVTQTIEASADFDDYDLTVRWPFALGPLLASAGITAKRLRGEIFIDDNQEDEPSRQQYDETFPELHAQLRLPLGKGFALAAMGQGIEYDGSKAFEWRASMELRFLDPLLLEAGWQAKRYNVNVDDYRMDTRLDGALLRAGLLFN